MFAENIEQIKHDWTDKYVVVDAARPELARFRDLVGQVKTVNMSGRALVEFADYNLNAGWYDIERSFLKQVPKPEPKPAAAKEKPAAKPAAGKAAPAKPAAGGEKKLSPLELARQQGASGAAKPAAPPAAKSTADILAAARGGAAAPAKPAAEKTAPAPAAPAKPAAGPAKADRGKMSVADMLAMARGQKSGDAAEAPATPPPAEAKAAAKTVAAAGEPDTAPAAPKKVDKSSMSVDQMIAHCRTADGR